MTRPRKALNKTAKSKKTTKTAKITKTVKFCKAMDERWWGNVIVVKDGPQQNSENYKNSKKCKNNANYEIWQGFENWQGNAVLGSCL